MMMNLFSAGSVPYASGGAVVLEALKALLPPERISVSDFAARNRWLANEGGGYVGHWSNLEAPYLTGPMEALTDPELLSVALVGPAQCGKTQVGQNWLYHAAVTDPADMLWYSATEFLISAFVKTSINTMIDINEPLRARVGRASAENSLSFKKFGSMSAQFLPGSMSSMISKSAPRIVADEFDAICATLGDVKTLLDVRRQTFGRMSMLLAISHPDLAEGMQDKHWSRGIMAMYRDSDRSTWWWQCPECGAYSSANPTSSRVMTIHYDETAPLDEIAGMARLLCPVNGCLIEDGQRRAMNLTGQWIGLGQHVDEDGTVHGAPVKRDIAGFWITGMMSPFTLGGVGALARARVQAERDFQVSGDHRPLRQVLSKQWGVPLETAREVASIDASVIADRAEADLPIGIIANGVRFVTCAIDVQNNRFELLTRGWGLGGESWVIDCRRIEADTAVSPADWDAVMRFAAGTVWPLADGSGRGLRARLVGFDAFGAAGVTQQGYDAWKRLRASRGARLLGRIDGRDCWTIIPLKGANGLQAARLQVVYPDATRKTGLLASIGHTPLGLFNPNLFKDDLAGQLAIAESGREGVPWAVHFPAALRAAFPPHPFFEQLVAERRGGNGRWHKINAGARNEAMDLMVMNHALAYLAGLTRIDWARPPGWAAEWDANTSVVPTGDAGAADAAPAAQPTTIPFAPQPNNPAAKRSMVSKLA